MICTCTYIVLLWFGSKKTILKYQVEHFKRLPKKAETKDEQPRRVSLELNLK